MIDLIIALPAYEQYAQAIADSLGISCIVITVARFANGELSINADMQGMSGKRVAIYGSIARHDDFFVYAFLIDTLRAHGVEHITAIVPYITYMRQNQLHAHGASFITLLSRLALDRLITIEPHAPELFASMAYPVTLLSMVDIIANYIIVHVPDHRDMCLVAPDNGAHAFVQAIAQRVDCPILVAEKIRNHDAVHIQGFSGTQMPYAIIIDDMIDSGSTMMATCRALRARGIVPRIGIFVHPVLSKPLGWYDKNIAPSVFVFGDTLAHQLPHEYTYDRLVITQLIAAQLV